MEERELNSTVLRYLKMCLNNQPNKIPSPHTHTPFLPAAASITTSIRGTSKMAPSQVGRAPV